MRVYRLEVIRVNAHPRSSFKRKIRPNRVGICCAGKAPPILYNSIPFPQDDFRDLYPFPEETFFGFPDTKMIEMLDQHVDSYVDMSKVVVAEYEVEPMAKTEHQVVFHKDFAQFITERKFRDFLTCQ